MNVAYAELVEVLDAGTVITSMAISSSGTHSFSFTAPSMTTTIRFSSVAGAQPELFYLKSININNNRGEVTSWADYYPFGEVLPGRNSNPTGMFGYQGQERISNSTNEVSGSRWYNFQLRMYNPSLGRFNTIDPYSQFNSPYLAMANNPISFVDPDGGRAAWIDAMAPWRLRIRRAKAFQDEKEAWMENKYSHRWVGQDNSGGNDWYHSMNLKYLGKTSRVDPLDLNLQGEGGSESVWSGNRWGAETYKEFGVGYYQLVNERAALAAIAERGMVNNYVALEWNIAVEKQHAAIAALSNATGVFKRQEGAEKSASDPITSIYVVKNGVTTIIWDITTGNSSYQNSLASTTVEYVGDFQEDEFTGPQDDGSSVKGGGSSLSDGKGFDYYAGASGDITIGANVSATLKNGVGFIFNPFSVVLAEGEASTHQSTRFSGAINGDLKVKQEFGAAYVVGLSYKHTFIDRNGHVLNQTHSVTLGGLGFLGATLEWNNAGLQNLKFGVDISGGAGLIGGASGGFQFGGIYLFDQ